MPKDFLQGASLKPTFIQHFKCGELNKHKVDAKHIKKKKADGDKEGENNEVEAVAE